MNSSQTLTTPSPSRLPRSPASQRRLALRRFLQRVDVELEQQREERDESVEPDVEIDSKENEVKKEVVSEPEKMVLSSTDVDRLLTRLVSLEERVRAYQQQLSEERKVAQSALEEAEAVVVHSLEEQRRVVVENVRMKEQLIESLNMNARLHDLLDTAVKEISAHVQPEKAEDGGDGGVSVLEDMVGVLRVENSELKKRLEEERDLVDYAIERLHVSGVDVALEDEDAESVGE